MLSLIREIFIAAYIGMNANTDAFNTAISITAIISGIISSSIVSSIMPMLSSSKNQEEETGSVNLILVFSLAIASLLGFLLVVLSRFIIAKAAPGYDRVTSELADTLLKISILRIVFIVSESVLNQYLYFKKHYYISQASSALSNVLIVIVLMARRGRIDIVEFAIYNTIVDAVHLALLIPSLRNAGYKLQHVEAKNYKFLKTHLLLSYPTVLSYFSQNLTAIFNKGMATKVQTGALSGLSYANSIFMMINMTITYSITSIFYPNISKAVGRKDSDEIKKVTASTIGYLVYILIPATVVVFLNSSDIVSILLERGKFGPLEVEITSKALRFYVLGLLPFGLCDIFSKFSYSFRNTLTPMFIVISGSIVNIFFLSLVKAVSIESIALANTIMYWEMAIAYRVILRQQKMLGIPKKPFFEVLLPTVVMMVILHYFPMKGILNGFLRLTTRISLSLIAFSVLLYAEKSMGKIVRLEQ